MTYFAVFGVLILALTFKTRGRPRTSFAWDAIIFPVGRLKNAGRMPALQDLSTANSIAAFACNVFVKGMAYGYYGTHDET